jgi:hypothetical protein
MTETDSPYPFNMTRKFDMLDLFNLNWWHQLWWNDKIYPADVFVTKNDDLFPEAGTRGVLVIGDPGTGKTRYMANQIFKRWRDDPKLTVFSFDWQGGFTKVFLDLMSRERNYETLMQYAVVDELGNEERVLTKPEFHPDYGLTDEEQVNRVVGNMQKFAEFMSKTAGFLVGVSVREIGKHLFRLLQVMRNDYGESWQITEALELLTDENLLRRAVKDYGQYAKPSKFYFEKQYIEEKVMPRHEKELTTRALRFLLGIIDSQVVRATLGYYKPSWTPKEATENGQAILIDAHKMINTPEAQHYLIVQAFSLVMDWINKREVDDPNNQRVIIVLDETFPLLQIDGFAEWLSMISPLYRARGIEIVILIQGMWQLDERLAKQIWSMGTIIAFRRDDIDEAELIARQLWNYDSHYVKNPARTDWQNPTTESQDGQDRMNGDWIQNFEPRQFVMRQYINEQEKQPGVIFVKKTKELPNTKQYITVKEIKERLRKRDGVLIRDALEVLKDRKLEEPPEEDYKQIKIRG